MISNKNYFLTPYFDPNNPLNSIQRRRSAIRRSNVLRIKTSNLLFTEFQESSTNNIHQQKIKRDLDRQSPSLIRRQRPPIENFSYRRQLSDINDVFGSQLQLIPRDKSPRISSLHSKPLNYSKTINENTIKQISKFSHSLRTPMWSPTLTEKEIISTQPSRSKSHSLRHYDSSHHHQTPIEKQNSISDLFISTKSTNNDIEIFKKTNIKDLVDEWEDPKSNVAVLSDEDDSVITNCNNPILIYNPQTSDHSSSPIFLPSSNDNSKSKPINLQRHPYSFSLAPVVEDINDEIY